MVYDALLPIAHASTSTRVLENLCCFVERDASELQKRRTWCTLETRGLFLLLTGHVTDRRWRKCSAARTWLYFPACKKMRYAHPGEQINETKLKMVQSQTQ